MSRFLRLGRARVTGAFIPAAALLSLSACMSWRSEPVSPAHLISTKKPPVVRVTRLGSSKVILEDPEVARDTLYGRPRSSSGDKVAGPAAIALADIEKVEIYKSDPGKTLLLVGGIGMVTLAIFCAEDALGCGTEDVAAVPLGMGSK